MVMHMEQVQCDQAKIELKNKPWLDQKQTITINSDQSQFLQNSSHKFESDYHLKSYFI